MQPGDRVVPQWVRRYLEPVDLRDRRSTLDTGVAEAAHVDLDLTVAHRARRLRATNGELDLGHAFDGAALGADEVRMRRVVIVRDGLESPHVIADIGAARETGAREVGEVAVDRGAIPRLRGQAIGGVAVGHRCARSAKQLEHGDPRGRRTQAARAQRGAELLGVLRHDVELYCKFVASSP